MDAPPLNDPSATIYPLPMYMYSGANEKEGFKRSSAFGIYLGGPVLLIMRNPYLKYTDLMKEELKGGDIIGRVVGSPSNVASVLIGGFSPAHGQKICHLGPVSRSSMNGERIEVVRHRLESEPEPAPANLEWLAKVWPLVCGKRLNPRFAGLVAALFDRPRRDDESLEEYGRAIFKTLLSMERTVKDRLVRDRIARAPRQRLNPDGSGCAPRPRCTRAHGHTSFPKGVPLRSVGDVRLAPSNTGGSVLVWCESEGGTYRRWLPIADVLSRKTSARVNVALVHKLFDALVPPPLGVDVDGDDDDGDYDDGYDDDGYGDDRVNDGGLEGYYYADVDGYIDDGDADGDAMMACAED